MHLNQRVNQNEVPMPLIMCYTPYTKIEEDTDEASNLIYDDSTQIIVYNMRQLRTRCLKTSTTRKI